MDARICWCGYLKIENEIRVMKRIFTILLSLLILATIPSCNKNNIKPEQSKDQQEEKGPDSLPDTTWSCNFMSLTWELYFMSDTGVQITWRDKNRKSKSARGQYSKDGNKLIFTQPFAIDEIRTSELTQTIIEYILIDATISGDKMQVSMNVTVVGNISGVRPGDHQLSFTWKH